MKIILKNNLPDIMRKSKEYLFKSSESNLKLSISVGVGVFTGIIPIWGFQTILAIILAFIFRLNKIVMLAVSNFSQPPVTPFVILASFLLGGLFINTETGVFHYSSKTDYEFIKNNLLQYVVGSIILAIILSLLTAMITYTFLNSLRRDGNEKNI